MLRVMADLLRLKKLPMADYDWPFWQSALVLLVLGCASMLGAILSQSEPSPSVVWLDSMSILYGTAIISFMYAFLTSFMAWWMRKGGRWFGQGSMFNVLVAASAIDLFSALLNAWGVLPTVLTVILSVYSVWVKANALVGISNGRASLAYCLLGILLSIIPAMVITGLLIGGLSGSLGLFPLPPSLAK